MSTIVIIRPNEMNELLALIEQSTIDFQRKENPEISDKTDIEIVRLNVNRWVMYHIREDKCFGE